MSNNPYEMGVRLEIALAQPNLIVLDSPEAGRLDRNLLGLEAQTNNLFVLDKDQLDAKTLGDPADTVNTQWVNLMGDAQTISIQRGAKRGSGMLPLLDLGTLDARIIGPHFDPLANQLMKPGAPVRLMKNDTVIWTGNLYKASSKYGLPGKPTVVSITAVDRVSQLSGINRYGITAGSFVMRVDDLLGSYGIPYSTFGGTANLAANQVETSLLNHLQLTADSELGRLFISKNNQVYVYGQDYTPTSSGLVLSDKDRSPGYTGIDATYDMGDLFNEVTVKNMTRTYNDQNEAQNVETSYGPFVNETSIATWYSQAGDVTTNLDSEEQIRAVGEHLLDWYSRPFATVQSVIFNAGAAPDKAANLELFQTVRVEYENEYFALDEEYLVMGMKHDLNKDRWLVTLDLTNYERNDT